MSHSFVLFVFCRLYLSTYTNTVIQGIVPSNPASPQRLLNSSPNSSLVLWIAVRESHIISQLCKVNQKHRIFFFFLS